jgi:hypothetical protein
MNLWISICISLGMIALFFSAIFTIQHEKKVQKTPTEITTKKILENTNIQGFFAYKLGGTSSPHMPVTTDYLVNGYKLVRDRLTHGYKHIEWILVSILH